jgi:pyruvate-ferredoxin/flavodoxin oxidoreductase
MTHQKLAVTSGYWPLYRYHPSPAPDTHPFSLDSKAPTVPLREFLQHEARFAVLERSDPERAGHLQALAQADVDERWHYYEQLAGVERSIPVDAHEDHADGTRGSGPEPEAENG